MWKWSCGPGSTAWYLLNQKLPVGGDVSSFALKQWFQWTWTPLKLGSALLQEIKDLECVCVLAHDSIITFHNTHVIWVAREHSGSQERRDTSLSITAVCCSVFYMHGARWILMDQGSIPRSDSETWPKMQEAPRTRTLWSGPQQTFPVWKAPKMSPQSSKVKTQHLQNLES